MDFLIHELPQLLPSQAEPLSCLVHGDYRMDNVLFNTDPTTGIAAILDWELSTLGDGLADLAYVLPSLVLSSTPPSSPFPPSSFSTTALSVLLLVSQQSIHERPRWCRSHQHRHPNS
jgi:aminoglycoside phosphotransferase (APT) family kinase protein